MRTVCSGSLPSRSQPPFCLEQGLRAESGPEECPEGGKELGRQPLGGLKCLPLTAFRPGRAKWAASTSSRSSCLSSPQTPPPHTHPLLTSVGLSWPCQPLSLSVPQLHLLLKCLTSFTLCPVTPRSVQDFQGSGWRRHQVRGSRTQTLFSEPAFTSLCCWVTAFPHSNHRPYL